MGDRAELPSGLNYLDAGVDIEEGNRFVAETLEPLVRETYEHSFARNVWAKKQNGLQNSPQDSVRTPFLVGFGATFDPKAAGFDDPILEMACDGVGTKARIAIEEQKYDGLGIDLVAMCVNDLLARGAQPLAFLDYIGYANFPQDVQEDVQATLMESIARGCIEAGCALVGGETAQMPGFYKEGDFSLAGFVLGAIERDAPFRRTRPQIGDKLFAVKSSGFHANGFSLVRRVLDENPSLKKDKEFLHELLTPTRIYTKFFAPLIEENLISGIAHITGGGIKDNLPFILQAGQKARIDLSLLPRPEVFTRIQKAGAISEDEMRRVFNCGVGVIMSVAPKNEVALKAILPEPVFAIGLLEENPDKQARPYAYFADQE